MRMQIEDDILGISVLASHTRILRHPTKERPKARRNHKRRPLFTRKREIKSISINTTEDYLKPRKHPKKDATSSKANRKFNLVPPILPRRSFHLKANNSINESESNTNMLKHNVYQKNRLRNAKSADVNSATKSIKSNVTREERNPTISGRRTSVSAAVQRWQTGNEVDKQNDVKKTTDGLQMRLRTQNPPQTKKPQSSSSILSKNIPKPSANVLDSISQNQKPLTKFSENEKIFSKSGNRNKCVKPSEVLAQLNQSKNGNETAKKGSNETKKGNNTTMKGNGTKVITERSNYVQDKLLSNSNIPIKTQMPETERQRKSTFETKIQDEKTTKHGTTQRNPISHIEKTQITKQVKATIKNENSTQPCVNNAQKVIKKPKTVQTRISDVNKRMLDIKSETSKLNVKETEKKGHVKQIPTEEKENEKKPMDSKNIILKKQISQQSSQNLTAAKTHQVNKETTVKAITKKNYNEISSAIHSTEKPTQPKKTETKSTRVTFADKDDIIENKPYTRKNDTGMKLKRSKRRSKSSESILKNIEESVFSDISKKHHRKNARKTQEVDNNVLSKKSLSEPRLYTGAYDGIFENAQLYINFMTGQEIAPVKSNQHNKKKKRKNSITGQERIKSIEKLDLNDNQVKLADIGETNIAVDSGISSRLKQAIIFDDAGALFADIGETNIDYTSNKTIEHSMADAENNDNINSTESLVASEQKPPIIGVEDFEVELEKNLFFDIENKETMNDKNDYQTLDHNLLKIESNKGKAFSADSSPASRSLTNLYRSISESANIISRCSQISIDTIHRSSSESHQRDKAKLIQEWNNKEIAKTDNAQTKKKRSLTSFLKVFHKSPNKSEDSSENVQQQSDKHFRKTSVGVPTDPDELTNQIIELDLNKQPEKAKSTSFKKRILSQLSLDKLTTENPSSQSQKSPNSKVDAKTYLPENKAELLTFRPLLDHPRYGEQDKPPLLRGHTMGAISQPINYDLTRENRSTDDISKPFKRFSRSSFRNSFRKISGSMNQLFRRSSDDMKVKYSSKIIEKPRDKSDKKIDQSFYEDPDEATNQILKEVNHLNKEDGTLRSPGCQKYEHFNNLLFSKEEVVTEDKLLSQKPVIKTTHNDINGKPNKQKNTKNLIKKKAKKALSHEAVVNDFHGNEQIIDEIMRQSDKDYNNLQNEKDSNITYENDLRCIRKNIESLDFSTPQCERKNYDQKIEKEKHSTYHDNNNKAQHISNNLQFGDLKHDSSNKNCRKPKKSLTNDNKMSTSGNFENSLIGNSEKEGFSKRKKDQRTSPNKLAYFTPNLMRRSYSVSGEDPTTPVKKIDYIGSFFTNAEREQSTLIRSLSITMSPSKVQF